MAVQSNSSGNAFITSYTDGQGLLLVVCSISSCELNQPKILDTASLSEDVGLYPSIAVAPDTGKAVIAYHDATNLALKMIFCTGADTDKFCNTQVTKVFPSTFGWDPSVIFDQRNGLPSVAYSTPPTGEVIIMACQDRLCSNSSFVALAGVATAVSTTTSTVVTGPIKHRFETIKFLEKPDTLEPFVVAHDAFSGSMFALVVQPDVGCGLQCPAPTYQVVITSPVASPFATKESFVSIQGFLTPYSNNGDVGGVVVNNQTNLALEPTSGTFEGVVALVEGTNFLTIAALLKDGSVAGFASTIVVRDGSLPLLTIVEPGQDITISTVAPEIFVRGTASSSAGIASVEVLNKATGVSIFTLSTSPDWSAVVALKTKVGNNVTVTATDGLGNVVSESVVILQTGLDPRITCGSDFTIECGTAVPQSAARVINCAEAPTRVETIEAGCGGTSTVVRTFESCGESCVQRITSVDTTPPIITCPADAAVSCGDLLAGVPPPMASDVCLGAALAPVLTTVSGAPLACTTSQAVTYTVTDGCNSPVSCTFQLTVGGATIPGITTTTGGGVGTTTTPSGGLTEGDLGGLIAGVVLLILILLLAILIALWWLRRKKKAQDESGQMVPIMSEDYELDDISTSVSSVTSSRLYKEPTDQGVDNTDMADIF
jgi:hypothetical protein